MWSYVFRSPPPNIFLMSYLDGPSAVHTAVSGTGWNTQIFAVWVGLARFMQSCVESFWDSD